MKIVFIYPRFERHAEAHPELKALVPANEYLGSPSLGIASVAGQTPPGIELAFHDDRLAPFDFGTEADLYALSFFTPAASRGLEIAQTLKSLGKTVVAGGIFPSMMPDEVAKVATSVVVGEGEAVWPKLIADFQAGKLLSRYQSPPVDLAQIAPPRLDLYFGSERPGFAPDDYPLQFSRGCPLHCDACVLPEQLGPEMRFHSDANLDAALAALGRANKMACFTEDTSVFGMQGTRRRFVAFLERCAEMQGQGKAPRFSYVGISMPMILSLDPKLVERLRKVGIDRFYLVGGFDPITRQAFGQGNPEAMQKAERAIGRCLDAGIDPYVSFLVGNPDDDEGVFDRMLDFAHRARVDLAEFCVSTPYPGTPLWRRYVAEERIFDRTWKHYNDANVVFKPHKMSVERLRDGYLYLWREFYRNRKKELQQRSHERRTIQF